MPVNPLQKNYREYMDQVGKLYPPVISAIVENLSNGEKVADAVDNGFKSTSYTAQNEELTVSGLMNVSGEGLGKQLTLNTKLAPDYFLFTQFSDGVTLSDTLHDKSSQKAVKAVLNDYFKFKGNTQELIKNLIGVNRKPNTDIPKSIRGLIALRGEFSTPKEIQRYKRQVNKAMGEIGVLNARKVTQTTELQRAYTKLISAIDIGEAKGIDNALNYAFDKKVKYINGRIARTEFAQTYDMSFERQINDDPLVIGFEWDLSSGHPRPDICDCYAEADAYGMGAGIYPIGAGARVPAHPNCLCVKNPVYSDPDNPTRKGRYSEKRMNEYLSGLSSYKRRQILGVKNSKRKSDYSKGLAKQGFQIYRKPLMISKKVIQPIKKGGE